MPRKTAFGMALTLILAFAWTVDQTAKSTEPLAPSLALLGGGCQWAAREGRSALFVNWKDNWVAHHLTDGSSWGPWPPESELDDMQFSVSHVLQQYGFMVQLVGDIPEDISGYDLVFIQAYWAVEPRHEPQIREYLLNGGGVVIWGGVPTLLAVYCKDWWPYRYGLGRLTPMEEWFGAEYYRCTRGVVSLVVDNPFGTGLPAGGSVFEGQGDFASLIALHNDVQIVALWNTGNAFAFTHEYGQGRVYYQATHEVLSPSLIPATLDIKPNTLNLGDRGQWLTAYIELPEGYDPVNINASTILLNGTIAPVLDQRYGFVTNQSEYLQDFDGDGSTERMVKFDREAVLLYIIDQRRAFENVALILFGRLTDGTAFQGEDSVSVQYPR